VKGAGRSRSLARVRAGHVVPNGKMTSLLGSHLWGAVVAVGLVIVAGCERAKHVTVEDVNSEAAAVPSAVDADREFLRRMLDHHAGLTRISHAAIERAGGAKTRNAARYVDLRHDVERDRIRRILRREFRDSSAAQPLPEHSAAGDSLALLSGREYDRAFQEWVIAHHREALRMIETYLPRLRRSDVKALARDIRENQLREITELETVLRER
jgi:predicted outer membrane protein